MDVTAADSAGAAMDGGNAATASSITASPAVDDVTASAVSPAGDNKAAGSAAAGDDSVSAGVTGEVVLAASGATAATVASILRRGVRP